jgi:hypothetical protein
VEVGKVMSNLDLKVGDWVSFGSSHWPKVGEILSFGQEDYWKTGESRLMFRILTDSCIWHSRLDEFKKLSIGEIVLHMLEVTNDD